MSSRIFINIKYVAQGKTELHKLPFGKITGLCILDGCNKEMVIFSDHLYAPRKIAFILPDPTGDLGKWMLEKYFLFKAKHGISWAL